MTLHFRTLLAEAEGRHPELAGHGERTASFAVATAYAMGVTGRRLASLRIAAALHFAFGPCDVTKQQIELDDALQAADMIRGMTAEWNMASLESSIIAAACSHDRARVGLQPVRKEYRPEVLSALESIAELIHPVDYVK